MKHLTTYYIKQEKRLSKKSALKSSFTEEELTPILVVRMGSRVNDDKPKNNKKQ